jgi:ABC-type branched-subunit amino acid transport system permease subunit
MFGITFNSLGVLLSFSGILLAVAALIIYLIFRQVVTRSTESAKGVAGVSAVLIIAALLIYWHIVYGWIVLLVFLLLMVIIMTEARRKT